MGTRVALFFFSLHFPAKWNDWARSETFYPKQSCFHLSKVFMTFMWHDNRSHLTKQWQSRGKHQLWKILRFFYIYIKQIRDTFDSLSVKCVIKKNPTFSVYYESKFMSLCVFHISVNPQETCTCTVNEIVQSVHTIVYCIIVIVQWKLR